MYDFILDLEKIKLSEDEDKPVIDEKYLYNQIIFYLKSIQQYRLNFYFCKRIEFFDSHMITNKLTGMGVALITPFKDDESVDFEALARLVEHLIKNNTDYLVVLGTTAETPTLTEQEKEEVTRFVVQCCGRQAAHSAGV